METKIVVGMTGQALEIFKRRLEGLLEKRDMSLSTLARGAGVPISTLHDIIRAGVKVGKKSIGYLEAVCEFLNTDLDSMIRVYPCNEEAKLIYSDIDQVTAYKRIPKKIQSLKETCREISSERMKSYFDSSEVREEEIFFEEKDHPERVFSFMFGDLDYAKFNLKTFFDRDDISRLMGISGEEDRTHEDIDDFMREFLNITMGGIKRVFEKDGPEVNTSLPLIMREQDAIFLDVEENIDTRVVHDLWSIEVKGIKIICEISFEVYNPQRFYAAMGRTNFKRDDLANHVFVF